MKEATILLLLCDTPADNVRTTHGTYHDIFSTLFNSTLSSFSPADNQVKLVVKSFDVVSGQYPSDHDLEMCNGVVLTGSKHTAYHQDEWIIRLIDYVRHVKKVGKKIIGICFGHQIVAMAFGNEKEESLCVGNQEWEVGVVKCDLTDWGRKVFGEGDSINIQQMHRDHVPRPPSDFHLLARTSISPNQGMIHLSTPTSTDTKSSTTTTPSFSLSSIDILTVQGHPEFTKDIVEKIVEVREGMGIFSKERAKKAKEDAGREHDGLKISNVILKVLDVLPPSNT